MATYVNKEDLYDRKALKAALRLVATRSPLTRMDAAKALQCSSATSMQMRFDMLMPTALGDESAQWTAEECAQLVDCFHGGIGD